MRVLDTALSKLKSAEVKADIAATIAAMAKEWLRVSPELKNTAAGYLPNLDEYDSAMAGVLSASKQRSRASAYRSKLRPFADGFLDAVVLPLMRFEGSPSQAASRQLEALFATSVSADELVYVQEAARCSSMHCHRAAIIMLWAAGVSRIHNRIQAAGFLAFNNAAQTASAKKGPPYNRITKGLAVSSLAELQRARDADILAVGMELWSYDLQAFEERTVS